MKSKVGRKKINPLDKQVVVQFYTKQRVIDEHGGMENVRLLVKEFIEKGSK